MLPGQWERIEKAAKGTKINANELLVQLAMEVLNQRELFGKDAKVRVASASLFIGPLVEILTEHNIL